MECKIETMHCQLCGQLYPESSDGYTFCCNEPVEYGPCDHEHSLALIPSRTPSPHCESGSRPGCTCDYCF